MSVPPLTSVSFEADVIVDVAGRRDDGRPRAPPDQEPSSTNVAHRWRRIAPADSADGKAQGDSSPRPDDSERTNR